MDARPTDDPTPRRGATRPTLAGGQVMSSADAPFPFTLITLARRLLRITQQQLTQVLADTDLSPAHAGYLWAIRQHPQWSQQELAREFGISPAQASGLVEELERRELIVGGRSPVDRRRHAWQLTPRATELLAVLDRRLAEHWSASSALLPGLEALCAALTLSTTGDSFEARRTGGGTDSKPCTTSRQRSAHREVA